MHGTYHSPILGTHHTHDGGTVDVTRRGLLLDLHVRDAAGRTVATVEMDEAEAEALLSGLADELPDSTPVRDAYSDGFYDGYGVATEEDA